MERLVTLTPASAASPTPEELRSAREAAGLSQQQLASRADCSIASVQLFERGLAPRRSDVLPRIVAALQAKRPDGLTTA